ncbi:MAG: copper chaperone PCu(A)C [Oscillochloris sp.]|nr:copper chaperone PCu(A)C [Oscillochloris sp.]
MMLLAACGASPASPTSAPTTASPTSAPTAESPANSSTTPITTTTSITIKDPWARAAVMTGAAASGEMNHADATAEPMQMPGTIQPGDSDSHTASGGTSAAYLVINNSASSADFLIKAESDVADNVELHTMTMENGVMKMSPVEKIEIPAGGSQELKPRGFHVMLIGLRHDLKEGEVVKLTLTFQNAGTIEVEAPVRKP